MVSSFDMQNLNLKKDRNLFFLQNIEKEASASGSHKKISKQTSRSSTKNNSSNVLNTSSSVSNETDELAIQIDSSLTKFYCGLQ